METMVYFTIDGQEICGRVDPGSAAGPGESMRLYANMDHMHLIDPADRPGAVTETRRHLPPTRVRPVSEEQFVHKKPGSNRHRALIFLSV